MLARLLPQLDSDSVAAVSMQNLRCPLISQLICDAYVTIRKAGILLPYK
jgi:hypothetical protein